MNSNMNPETESRFLTGLFEYVAVGPNELSFRKDALLLLQEKDTSSDWWFVKGLDGESRGKEGYIPASYVAHTSTEAGKIAKELLLGLEKGNNSLPALYENNKSSRSSSTKHDIGLKLPPLPKSNSKLSSSSDENSDNSADQVQLVQNIQSVSKIQINQKDLPNDSHSETSSGSDYESSEEESREFTDQEASKEEDLDDDDVRHVLYDLQKRKSISKTRTAKLNIPEISENLNLPTGFRISSLGKSFHSGSGHALQFLTPELNSTGISFKDLHLTKKNMVRKRTVKYNFAFSVIEAKSMSNPSSLHVVGRMVRLALYDKTSIISNIHSVPAYQQADNENNWRFSSKSSMLFPSDQGNSCFLRSAEVDIKLCLLFELILIVKSPESFDSNGLVEISCGWSLLPLFTSDGRDLESKTYEMQVFGGSPTEKDVELAAPIAKTLGFFSKAPAKFPRLSIKVWKLGSAAIKQINDLPDVFVGNLSAIPVLAFYRRVLVNTLIGPGKENHYGSRYEPILALIPHFINELDLLEHLVILWNKRLKGMPRKDRKSYHALKSHFTSAVLSLWPLLFLDLPKNIPGNIENAIIRTEVWLKIQVEGVVSYLSRPSLQTKKFDAKELEYCYLFNHEKYRIFQE